MRNEFSISKTNHRLIKEENGIGLYELTYPANNETVVGYHIGTESKASIKGKEFIKFNFLKSAYTLKGAERRLLEIISKKNTK